MSTGLMFDDKVLCPWHAAAFSVKTGAIENAPGMDSLPKFDIIEKDGKNFVTVPLVLPRKQTMELAKRDPNDKRRYVIIGGGPAGVNCAEALRQSNYTGEITVISAEDIVAYDRTLLTKVLPTGDATKFKLRSDEFLKNADIDFVLSTRADSVDSNAKTVKLSNGETIHYDKLCIATGTSPFRPRVQGIDFKNVFVLRSHNDQEQIKKLTANAKKVVILGSGFIGSESASALKLQYKDAMEVSIVSMEAVPFQRQFGTEVGKMFLSEHEKNGVKMYMQRKLKEFRGEGDLAKTVVLEDGTEIEADLVLVATGVLPATKFLEGSGI
jgi:apoptosis-inducing factor 3